MSFRSSHSDHENGGAFGEDGGREGGGREWIRGDETARNEQLFVRKSDDAEDEFSERFSGDDDDNDDDDDDEREEKANPGGRAHAGAENGRWIKFLRRGR